MLHEAFKKIGASSLQEGNLLELVKKLIGLLSPENRFAISKLTANMQIVDSILKKLYTLNIDKLLVYATFEPNSISSNAKPTTQQAREMLECLSKMLTDEATQKGSSELIQQILKGFELNEYETIVVNELKDVPLFLGSNHHKEKPDIYKYSELVEIQSKGSLFKGKNETDITIALNKALPDCKLTFIEENLAEILKKLPSFNVPRCDRNSCLQLLTKKPTLASPELRIKLLKELITYE